MHKRSEITKFAIAKQNFVGFAEMLIQILTDGQDADLKELKFSVSVYVKQFYRTVQSEGF